MPCCPIPTYFKSNNFIFLLCYSLRCYYRIFIKKCQGCSPSVPLDDQSQLIQLPNLAFIFVSEEAVYPRARMDLWSDSVRAQSSSQTDHYSDNCLYLLCTLYLCSLYRRIPIILNFLCTPRQCLIALPKLLDPDYQFPIILKVFNSYGCF